MDALHQLADLLSSGRITCTPLDDGTGVLLDVESLRVYSLNVTGMFLVDALRRGATDAETLTRQLVAGFEVDEATARADVAEFVKALAKVAGT
jgi:hypothetical protein